MVGLSHNHATVDDSSQGPHNISRGCLERIPTRLLDTLVAHDASPSSASLKQLNLMPYYESHTQRQLRPLCIADSLLSWFSVSHQVIGKCTHDVAGWHKNDLVHDGEEVTDERYGVRYRSKNLLCLFNLHSNPQATSGNTQSPLELQATGLTSKPPKGTSRVKMNADRTKIPDFILITPTSLQTHSSSRR